MALQLQANQLRAKFKWDMDDGNRQSSKKTRVGGGDLIDIVFASNMSKNKSSSVKFCNKARVDGGDIVDVLLDSSSESNSRSSSTSSSTTTVGSRVRSASVGRDKRSDLQARY